MAQVFKQNYKVEGLKPNREYIFEQYAGSPAGTFAENVRKLANGLINSNGGVIYFGVCVKGIVKGILIQSRKDEDEYRLSVDHTVGSFLPFVPPSNYRVQFHRLQYSSSLFVIELKVAAGDIGECYEDGRNNMYLVENRVLLGPLYPQEIKDLALMRYKELTDSFKFKFEGPPVRSGNKTIVVISDDEDEDEGNGGSVFKGLERIDATTERTAVSNSSTGSSSVTTSGGWYTAAELNNIQSSTGVGNDARVSTQNGSGTKASTNSSSSTFKPFNLRRPEPHSTSSRTDTHSNKENEPQRCQERGEKRKRFEPITYNRESAYEGNHHDVTVHHTAVKSRNAPATSKPTVLHRFRTLFHRK